MGMKDRSLIDKINPTFIALTATAIHHCLSAWKTGEFRVPPEFASATTLVSVRNTQVFRTALTPLTEHHTL